MNQNKTPKDVVTTLLYSAFTPAYVAEYGQFPDGLTQNETLVQIRNAERKTVAEFFQREPEAGLQLVEDVVRSQTPHIREYLVKRYHMILVAPGKEIIPNFLTSLALVVRDVLSLFPEDQWDRTRKIAINVLDFDYNERIEIIPAVKGVWVVNLLGAASQDGSRPETTLLPQILKHQEYPAELSGYLKRGVAWAGAFVAEWIPGIFSLHINRYAKAEKQELPEILTSGEPEPFTLDSDILAPAPELKQAPKRGPRKK